MVYEFKCTAVDCGAITERIQPITDNLPVSMDCAFCGQTALLKVSAPAIHGSGKSGSSKDFDRVVGADADRRWKSIHERQEQRDKVRRETNTVGIAATGYNDFRPISEQQKRIRTGVTEAVARDGFHAET